MDCFPTIICPCSLSSKSGIQNMFFIYGIFIYEEILVILNSYIFFKHCGCQQVCALWGLQIFFTLVELSNCVYFSVSIAVYGYKLLAYGKKSATTQANYYGLHLKINKQNNNGGTSCFLVLRAKLYAYNI